MVSVDEFIEDTTASIRDQIGNEYTVIALSGGVGSLVTAALAYEAVGEQLAPVYVSTGLIREGETEQIAGTFSFMESLRVVNARGRFFDTLGGVVDPEEKHKVIGEQFIREFEHEAKETDAQYLVQGTIYPDHIESEGNVESHHNTGGLPDVVDFGDIVEPVRDLYRDEIREVARALSLESIITKRMPFPGPGLAIRVLGGITPEEVQAVRGVYHVVEDETEKYDPWQAFAAVIGKGTGVKGDNRVRGWIVSVRFVESRDGMTARTQELPWDALQCIQSCITETNENVVRVVYDMAHRPPTTIEYE